MSLSVRIHGKWLTMVCLSFIFLIGTFGEIIAQELSVKPPVINVLENTVHIQSASSGGLYAPQFSPFDIDEDGIDEIVVFDRFSELFSILKWNDVENTYELDFGIRVSWPRVHSWVLVRDFDDDGIGDLFTQGQYGIAVWKGKIQDGVWEFTKMTGSQFIDDSLIFKSDDGSTTNLYHAASDIPVIEDLDHDGDIDILTFETSGSYLYLYECTTEKSGKELDYKLSNKCWGSFVENGNTNGVKLSQSPSFCPLPFSTRHTGSSSCLLDIDKDSIPDLLLGDMDYPTLRVLYNGISADSGFITHQDNVFPEFSEPAYIYDFPAAYKLDYNRDGILDVLVANNGSVDYDKDGLYLYEGTKEEEKAFQWVSSNWLFDQIFDLGRFSAPLFIDVDGNEQKDVLIAYNLSSDALEPVNRLAFLKRDVSDLGVEYTVEDGNFLKLGEFISDGIRPVMTAGDIDGDGDLDLVVGMSNGDIHLLENGSGESNRFVLESFVENWQELMLGSGAAPELYDIDGDGLLDLLVGSDRGKVNFFKNTGSPEIAVFEPDPSYYPNSERFGNIRISSPSSILGRSAPRMVKHRGEHILCVGTYDGNIRSFRINREDLYFSTFEEVELFKDAFLGKNSNFSILDSRERTTEIVAGNIAGGLQFFETEILTNASGAQNSHHSVSAFPNPAHNTVIHFDVKKTVSRGKYVVYNAVGKRVVTNTFYNSSFSVDTLNWESGVYFVVITFSSGERATKKLVIQ